MNESYRYYLGLGTNLGDKEQNLRRAVDEMEKQIGKVVSLSAFYATDPWGFQSANTFLNACCCISTPLAPHDMLLATQQIERTLGRTQKSVDGAYHDRLIDIDLLLCYRADGTPVTLTTPTLTLPHPLMWQRDFVTRPLAEILTDK